MTGASAGTNEELIRSFYRAVAGRDGDAVATLVGEHFTEDAMLQLPGSLPYGGTVEGRNRLERVFRGAAGATEPVGPSGLEIVDVIDGGDRCAVQLRFDWRAPAGGGAVSGTGAVELWTFADGRVQEIAAYYWDTAACVAVLAQPERSSEPQQEFRASEQGQVP